jgi:predicted ATP-grasp superfamily ATP-dependent carboligase
MVEFKQDRRTGELRLMEINGRFWGSLQLAIDAGVDFPGILVNLASGAHPPPVIDFRIGVKTRWFWGDFDAFWMVLSRSREQLDLPVSHPGRARLLWEFVKSWGAGVQDEMFRLDDLSPWWLETRRWLLR